jgi:hypothetical protein
MRARLELALVITLAALAGMTAPAMAGCASGNITNIGFSSTALSPYNPFTSFTPTLVTVTATASCTVELAFHRPTLPAQMTGPGVLDYDIRLNGGSASLLFTSGDPPTTQSIVVGPSSPGTANVQISVPSGQVVADGINYGDASVSAQVFDRNGSTLTLLRAQTMPITGSVAKVCQLPPPSNTTLNFTAAIANGRPNPGDVRRATFDGVRCTAPTKVRLSGMAMQLQPTASANGFDNFIAYRASATFNAASIVLQTGGSITEATSAGHNTASGATLNGSISVDVNLLAGRPLLAGTYGATLTVSIDPTL